jgi:Zn-finger nucleic acid-binding protein
MRLESIKRVTRTPTDELAQEAAAFAGDTTDRVQCPRCRVRMRKEELDVPGTGLHTDVCDSCRLVWFDGGELALLQLAYEQSAEFHNVDELRQRMRELEASPERKAAFEAALAKLPESQFTLESAFSEGGALLLGALIHAGTRQRRSSPLDWLVDDD